MLKKAKSQKINKLIKIKKENKEQILIVMWSGETNVIAHWIKYVPIVIYIIIFIQ